MSSAGCWPARPSTAASTTTASARSTATSRPAPSPSRARCSRGVPSRRYSREQPPPRRFATAHVPARRLAALPRLRRGRGLEPDLEHRPSATVARRVPGRPARLLRLRMATRGRRVKNPLCVGFENSLGLRGGAPLVPWFTLRSKWQGGDSNSRPRAYESRLDVTQKGCELQFGFSDPPAPFYPESLRRSPLVCAGAFTDDAERTFLPTQKGLRAARGPGR